MEDEDIDARSLSCPFLKLSVEGEADNSSATRVAEDEGGCGPGLNEAEPIPRRINIAHSELGVVTFADAAAIDAIDLMMCTICVEISAWYVPTKYSNSVIAAQIRHI